MLPQVNGRIIEINSDTQSDDWDAPAGAGTPKWSGYLGTYIKTKITVTFSESEGALVKFRDVVLYVDQALHDRDGNRLELLTGDIITYVDNWGKQHTRRIMDDTNPILPQIPAAMTYRQLHLEAEKLEA